MKRKNKNKKFLKFQIKIFWIIWARNFEIRSFLISKKFGLWKPPKKTVLSKKIMKYYIWISIFLVEHLLHLWRKKNLRNKIKTISGSIFSMVSKSKVFSIRILRFSLVCFFVIIHIVYSSNCNNILRII